MSSVPYSPIEFLWRSYRLSLFVVPPVFAIEAMKFCAQEQGYQQPYTAGQMAYMTVVGVPVAIGGAYWPIVVCLTGLTMLGEHVRDSGVANEWFRSEKRWRRKLKQ